MILILRFLKITKNRPTLWVPKNNSQRFSFFFKILLWVNNRNVYSVIARSVNFKNFPWIPRPHIGCRPEPIARQMLSGVLYPSPWRPGHSSFSEFVWQRNFIIYFDFFENALTWIGYTRFEIVDRRVWSRCLGQSSKICRFTRSRQSIEVSFYSKLTIFLIFKYFLQSITDS